MHQLTAAKSARSARSQAAKTCLPWGWKWLPDSMQRHFLTHCSRILKTNYPLKPADWPSMTDLAGLKCPFFKLIAREIPTE